MGKYDGSLRYENSLTKNQEKFCQYFINEELDRVEAYQKAYPEAVNFTNVTIHAKLQKLCNTEKVAKRIQELIEIKKYKNQSHDEQFELLKKSPKEFLMYEFYQLVKDCKHSDDKSNRLKALESLAKMFNLYNEASNNTTFNTQLNNIVIKSKDLNEAITNIKSLVNKQS